MRSINQMLLAVVLCASSAFAGNITITGTGQASAPPECATLSVAVTSICYDSSRDAEKANATLAQQIKTTLEKYKNRPGDEVTASGGANLRQTETEYETKDDGTTKTVVLCRNGWRSNNTLILKTSKLDSLPQIQDEVLALIDQVTVDTAKAARTTAAIAQPVFDVEAATRQKLRTEAQHKAWEDALQQFNDFNRDCHFVNPQLKAVMAPNYRVIPNYDRSVAAPAASTSATPIAPENIIVQSTWQFVMSFDGASICATPATPTTPVVPPKP